MSESVQVVCRCRPFSEKERNEGHTDISLIDTINGTIQLKNPKMEADVKSFTFDATFDKDSSQANVYEKTARRIVDATLNGFNGTVFVYGQTGTGKTFSMQGIPSNPELRGIIPTCFNQIFDHISATQHKKFLVRISFLEIYNEEVKDLLVKPSKNPKSGLELKENPDSGVYVKDLSATVVKSVEEMQFLMDAGNKNRSVGATLMNENSSRSHSIFTITIESSEPGPDGADRYVSGKLNLVDLAGSERLSKTGATGDRLKEATKINLSLSALGNCISALVDGKSSHIPYRDSKLTRLLQDSLGGNAKTLMIATLSPASYNYEETLSTLRYANRAKSIKNKPKINEDPKDAMLREYQEEIERLKNALKAKLQGTNQKRKVTRKELKPSLNQETDESDESDMGESQLDAKTISQLQSEVVSEKERLLASKDMVIEEKQRITAEIEQRAADLEREKQEREALAQRLLGLEAKLLTGGVNIVDKVNQQEKELEKAHVKLQDQQNRERELRKKLEAHQENQLQLEESFTSLQEEVDVKSKKLKKLFKQLDSVKAEITDVKDQFRNEREELQDTIRELSKELNLKLCIIENFVPTEESENLEKRAVFDEGRDVWLINKKRVQSSRIERPISLATANRPISQYAKIMMSISDTSTRYRPDNVINLQLHLPERTTLSDEADGSDEIPIREGFYEEEEDFVMID